MLLFLNPWKITEILFLNIFLANIRISGRYFKIRSRTCRKPLVLVQPEGEVYQHDIDRSGDGHCK